MEAWLSVKHNKGTYGIDEQNIEKYANKLKDNNCLWRYLHDQIAKWAERCN